MPEITLYGIYLSPPVRGAALTAKALKLDINFVKTSPLTGDTKKPEFLAINPAHCIPTIQDGSFALWESRPIQTYLTQKYGKQSGFYPDCVQKRATIDRLLYFDMGTLYQRFMKYFFPVAFNGEKPDASLLANLHDGLNMLDNELSGNKYVTGDSVSVADHSLFASVSSMEAAGIVMDDHKNVSAWLTRCKTWSYFDQDIKSGTEEFGNFIRSKLEA